MTVVLVTRVWSLPQAPGDRQSVALLGGIVRDTELVALGWRARRSGMARRLRVAVYPILRQQTPARTEPGAHPTPRLSLFI